MISKEAEAIRTSILSINLTDEEITSLLEALRFSRSLISQANVRSFRQGDKVKFTSSRDRQIHIGTVLTVGRKNIVVRTPLGSYRVPASMLSAA